VTPECRTVVRSSKAKNGVTRAKSKKLSFTYGHLTYHVRAFVMPRFKQRLSIGLLVAGVVPVFAGLTRSVGFSVEGITASLAAVVALLYSGAVFFGMYAASHTMAPDTIFVFDRTFRLVAGVRKGLPIRAVLPAGLPGDLDARCPAPASGSTEQV
jgi:hypothetical protein